MTSIRRTLLVYLLLGVAAAAAVATWFTYNEARSEVGQLFDLQLKQLAYSTRIDDLVRGRQPALALPDNRPAAGVSEILTQIWDRDGVLVYWSRPDASLPVPVKEGYSNATYNGREWRVYTHVAGTHALQVAAALDEREAIATQTALRTLLPLLALIPILGVLIWYAVGKALQPLDAMSRAVARRRPDAMTPIPESRVPRELLPLAQSLNGLLARLDEALSAQRRFTADAAHELRTPLAALKLQAELAARAPDAIGRGLAIAELQSGVDRASHLVEQLLTMARLEPEGPGRDALPVDLAALARDAIVARAALAADKKIDLGLTRASSDPVRGDPASLAMLIANLLDNALRYTPTGGRIDVAVERNERASILSVIDTGPGIAPADRERVFERFYRVAGSAGAVGSGLGLSIVRRIADAHGASVDLDAGPGGLGLAVRVTFPAPAPAPA
ncbi:MAG: sensor histidine kinase N-terminal domain-containing protein [Burkholderiales bacterium]|nr:sensor histidine kinase N-terminal domain-containing protein [Burkholderiales bacterium]